MLLKPFKKQCSYQLVKLYSNVNYSPGYNYRNVCTKTRRMRHFRKYNHFIVECAIKIPLIFFSLGKLKYINQSIIPFITAPINQIPPRSWVYVKQG